MKKTYLYISILILLILNILIILKNKDITKEVFDNKKLMLLNNEKTEIVINELLQKDSLDILLDNMPLRENLILKKTDNSIITLEKLV